jgi:hypothetical protein
MICANWPLRAHGAARSTRRSAASFLQSFHRGGKSIMEKTCDLLSLTEMTHLQTLHNQMMEYANANHIGRASMEKIMRTLFVTLTIANLKPIDKILAEVKQEHETGLSAYAQYQSTAQA